MRTEVADDRLPFAQVRKDGDKIFGVGWTDGSDCSSSPHIFVFDGGSITCIYSASGTTWYEVTFHNIDWSADTYDLEIRDLSTDTIVHESSGRAFKNSVSSMNEILLRNGYNDGGSNSIWWDGPKIKNNPPVFNSNRTEPSDPKFGESVSYFANVTDDGNVSNVTLDVETDNKTLVTDFNMSVGFNGSEYNASDVITWQSKTRWINATFTATDNTGKTSTSSINKRADYLSEWQLIRSV